MGENKLGTKISLYTEENQFRVIFGLWNIMNPKPFYISNVKLGLAIYF